MVVILKLLYGTQEKEESKKNDRTSVTVYNIRWTGRGYKDVYLKLLKIEGRRQRGKRE
jgi:hypothetical protein